MNNYYTDKFRITEEQLRKLVSEGLSGGGDYCDLYFEDSFIGDVVLRDSEVNSGGFNSDFGCGVRVLNGDHTGYAYSESTDMASLLSAAKAAAAISSGNTSRVSIPATNTVRTQARYGFTRDWRTEDAASFVPLMEKLDKGIRARDSRAVKVLAVLEYQVSDILMYNSLGEMAYETRPLASLAASIVFQSGDKTVDQSVSRSFRMGVEMLSDSFIDELIESAVCGIDERFEAGRPKGGKMNVVMGAGASGILLHEAMGHAFEADFNRKGQSVFSERMGQQICRKGINIVDDGTFFGNRGSITFDDEGIPGQKTYMVRDGVLCSYLHDRISASYYGVSPTGNGRRESFRYNPIPRMRATYMEGGNDGSCADLIAGVHRGIFVNQFSNGEVKIGEGDFTFYVKSGFLIENGRLTMPVKDINIIGNGPEALADIVAVASDFKLDNGAWTCGKEQSAPVCCGMPSILVNKLTVGGAQ